jgi:hypothetical protein
MASLAKKMMWLAFCIPLIQDVRITLFYSKHHIRYVSPVKAGES